MSTDNTTNAHLKPKDDGSSIPDHLRTESESTADSSESSDSQSESGNESSGSSSDSQVEDGGSQTQTAEIEQNESDSGKSNESFKSMNASLVKSEVVGSGSGSVKVVSTPTRAAVKSTGKPVKVKSPGRSVTKSAEVSGAAVVAPLSGSEAASPVQVTPAKTLVFSSPSTTVEVDFDQLPLNSKSGGTSIRDRPVSPSLTEAKSRRSPGEWSGSEALVTKNSSDSQFVEPEGARKRSRTAVKTPSKEVRSPKTKRNKKDKEKSERSSARQLKAAERDQAKTVEQVQEQVRLLQAQLEEVRNIKSAKQAKKDRKHKADKSRKSKTRSSDCESSRSSSPDVPATSSRIAKISMGRKLQGLAMTRAKQLGSIRLVDVHDSEVIEALKVVNETVFPTDPTQAYGDFYRIPGTGLDHIQKHLNDLEDDIGAYLVASAKLNLELDHERSVARKQRVNIEPGSEFGLIWQFSNDLARAAGAPDKQIDAPSSSQAAGAVVGSGGGKAVVKEVKPHVDLDDKVGDGQLLSPAAGSSKSVKKKKSAGSKSEERG